MISSKWRNIYKEEKHSKKGDTSKGKEKVKVKQEVSSKEKSSTSKKRSSPEPEEKRKVKRRKLDKSTLNKSLDEVGRYI